MSRARWPILALALACRSAPSDVEAASLVQRYLRQSVDVYRSGDVRALAGVAGSDELRKVAGVVGAKGDMGLTMEAQLLDFHLERVERASREVRVVTRERWFWRDLQIGTGAQVGPESIDRYHLRYHLARAGDRWQVASVEFLEPPEVGRKTPAMAPAMVFH